MDQTRWIPTRNLSSMRLADLAENVAVNFQLPHSLRKTARQLNTKPAREPQLKEKTT